MMQLLQHKGAGHTVPPYYFTLDPLTREYVASFQKTNLYSEALLRSGFREPSHMGACTVLPRFDGDMFVTVFLIAVLTSYIISAFILKCKW